MSARSRKQSHTGRSLPPQTHPLLIETPALPDEATDVVRRTLTWTFSLPNLFSRGPSIGGEGSVKSSSDDIPAAEGEDTDGMRLFARSWTFLKQSVFCDYEAGVGREQKYELSEALKAQHNFMRARLLDVFGSVISCIFACMRDLAASQILKAP